MDRCYEREHEGENFVCVFLWLSFFLCLIGWIVFFIGEGSFQLLWPEITNFIPSFQNTPYLLNVHKYSSFPDRAAAFLNVLILSTPLLVLFCSFSYRPALGDLVPREGLLLRAWLMFFMGGGLFLLGCLFLMSDVDFSPEITMERTDVALASSAWFFVFVNSIFYSIICIVGLVEPVLMLKYALKAK